MKQLSSSRDGLLASLRQYSALLRARNAALMQLSHTSAEVRSMLRQDGATDIGDILERRERECQQCATLCTDETVNDGSLVTAAQTAENAPGEVGELARTVLRMHTDGQTLIETILACQNECEMLLRAKIETAALALQQSAQRRKLDLAYGPACRHDMPAFLDKQQ